MGESEKTKNTKLQRKQKRCQAILSQDSNIECVQTPTNFIAICNAGLSTGLQKEAVLVEVLKYGQVADVAMLSNKSYCFIQCPSIEESIRIFENIHGRAKLGQNESIVYLSYVKSLPDVPNPWAQSPPDGLIVMENFITPKEEAMLLEAVNALEGNIENSVLKHRRVKHFGYEFLYGTNNVDPSKPLKERIPKECEFLWSRLNEKVANLLVLRPDQLTVNVYEPGQGIPPHVDTHSAFLDPIYSLSLESDIVMEFRRTNNNPVPVLVPRRSLLIMSGESRYAWTHGITPRQMDVIPSREGGLTVEHRSRRTSLTFRQLRRNRCDCNYPELCDTFVAEQKSNGNQLASVASKLEEENVHKIYDEIASHFSETRYKPWPKVEEFLKSFEKGAILLDVGCGNGKYLAVNRDILKIGCDRSEGLLQVCSQRNCNVFQCNCLTLPFRNDSVDGCISIAVIHHLATEARRLQALREMARVTVPRGRCLIYVWAKNQEFNSKKSSYLHRNRNDRMLTGKSKDDSMLVGHLKSELVDLPIHMNRTQFQEQDVFVPWKLKGTLAVASDAATVKEDENDGEKKEFLRYYHVFEEGELNRLCGQVDDVEVENCYYDQGNWCVVFRKL